MIALRIRDRRKYGAAMIVACAAGRARLMVFTSIWQAMQATIGLMR